MSDTLIALDHEARQKAFEILEEDALSAFIFDAEKVAEDETRGEAWRTMCAQAAHQARRENAHRDQVRYGD